MGFQPFGTPTRLTPGAGVPQGSVGFGPNAAAFGALEFRPTNVFGSALKIYSHPDDITPDATLTGAKLQFGAGALSRNALNEGWTLQMEPWEGQGLFIAPDVNGAAIDAGGAGGLKGGRLTLSGPFRNGINARTAGDAINSDGANSGGQTSFNMIHVSQDTAGLATRGSCHQFQGTLDVVDPAGESDIYCEGLNCYMELFGSRRGALLANWESYLGVRSGFPARAVGVRAIVSEANTSASYSTAVFGATSTWPATGARAFEAYGAGTQTPGAAFAIVGPKGFNYGIVQLDSSGNITSGLDGAGGFFTKTKAGAPVDADFRKPQSGLLAVDTTNSKLFVRVGSVWKSVTVA